MKRSRPYRFLFLTFYLASLGAILYLLARGWSYYQTPLNLRPRHEDYWLLKPGGSLGHALGITGAVLMVLMQLYSLRKRWPRLRTFGRLNRWLDFHIYCGLIGPLLVVLHSSFKVGGLVAVSFWSMMAVVLSGVLGRYLYLQVPRRRSGDQLSLDEVKQLSITLTERLQSSYGVSPEKLHLMDEIALADIDPGRSLWLLLLRLPFDNLKLRRRLGSFQRGLDTLSAGSLVELRRLTLERVQLQRRIVMLGRLQELFFYWHVLHKPFAVVMYIFMAVHIGVAIVTGYGWAPQ